MSKNGDIKANKKDKEINNKVKGGAGNEEWAMESKFKLDFKKKNCIKALKVKQKEMTRICNCIPTNHYGILNVKLEYISSDIKRAYKTILF